MEKRYNFTETERQMQQFWEQEKIYKFNPGTKGVLYSIDTPPPTVSGSLHIGHLFSYTQAEIIARFRRMQGYNVFYPFGFDNNGLPTERLAERETGALACHVPRSEFARRCRQVSEKYEKEFISFWKSLGFSVDWSLQYRTISPDVCKLSQELFLELAEKGKAYMKLSPVLWCAECQTSIAQAELETTEKESAFHYIDFALPEGRVTVATTRPELLGACVCLFVNPSDIRYTALIGKTVTVPLYNYQIPVLADEKVSPEKGTGAVMCATFGDSTDAEWYLAHNLPYRKLLLPSGKMAEDIPFIAGLSVLQARREILRLLEESGLLCKTETIHHAVGTHDRCGKEVEIISSKQWYIDILSNRERFLEAAEKINWYPAQMKGRYIAWVKNLKWDWCISRQRYFGIPFPVWYCSECASPAFAPHRQLPVNPLESDYTGVCPCGCKKFIPESAVFDTWATSSITPQINGRTGQKLTPMSMRSHAHEIIRTWTFYTIVRSLYHTGDVPWKDLMISGFVLAKKGEKISKSKHSSESPAKLIETHSADVLRYWAAGAKLGTDTFFSPDELQGAKRFITKLWNAASFAVSHLADINLNAPPPFLPIDKWIMERVRETTASAANLLTRYEVGLAKQEIDDLFWKDFCDNYIELVKPRLYNPDTHGAKERGSAQHALYFTLLNLLKLYAIYVPHITEHIYQSFFRQYENIPSVHQLLWLQPAPANKELLLFGARVKNALFQVRKSKSESNLSMRAEIPVLQVEAEAIFKDWLGLTAKDLQSCTNARELKWKPL